MTALDGRRRRKAIRLKDLSLLGFCLAFDLFAHASEKDRQWLGRVLAAFPAACPKRRRAFPAPVIRLDERRRRQLDGLDGGRA